MNKKGDLSINYVIITILALMVLIVVALIFRQQITGFIQNITGISGGLGTDIKGTTDSLLP